MRMAEILAENLSGKSVVGSDGTELGMLYNITMDIKNGRLRNLLIDPAESVTADFDMDDQGHYMVPVGQVQAVKDHIVIAR